MVKGLGLNNNKAASGDPISLAAPNPGPGPAFVSSPLNTQFGVSPTGGPNVDADFSDYAVLNMPAAVGCAPA